MMWEYIMNSCFVYLRCASCKTVFVLPYVNFRYEAPLTSLVMGMKNF